MELLEKMGPLTREALLKGSGCPEGSLSRNLSSFMAKGTIVKAVTVENETVYVLAASQIQIRLRKSVLDAMQSLSLYPIETLATSYGTFSDEDYLTGISAIQGINLVQQCQYGHEVTKILNCYEDSKQLRLQTLFAKVILGGAAYCLQHRVSSMRRAIENQLKARPQRKLQIIRNNLEFFLEQGLRDVAPDFAQNKVHLRLLSLYLQSALPEESLRAARTTSQRSEPIRFSQEDKNLLHDFLSQLSRIRFMFVVPFGFSELEDAGLVSVADKMQCFESWMQRLKEGTLDTEHASFLFNSGTVNLKRFAKVLWDQDLRRLRDSNSKRRQLKHLLFSSSPFPIEEEPHLLIDLREPWDLLFLYERHAQGERPEFYSEIFSLVEKRRNEAKLKGFLQIPSKEKTVSKRIMTRNGFLIYYEGQEQPEIIGPDDRE
jgi:hypothetical protein